jgi:hypothetical protein
MNTLLFNPSLFFSEKPKNEVNFKYPILIMLVYAIIGLCSSILVVNKIKEFLPSDVSSFMLFATIGGAVGAIIGIFAYWIILTGIFYLISTAFHSEGSFKDFGVCKLWICTPNIQQYRRFVNFIHVTALNKYFVTESTIICSKYRKYV